MRNAERYFVDGLELDGLVLLEPMPLDEPLEPTPVLLEPVLDPGVLLPAPLVPEVLEPLEVPPTLEVELPSSCRQRSFSGPVSVSQRAAPVVALLEVEGEVLDVLGVVADGVLLELEPADGLVPEPAEVCPNDAADIANSAAAVAVARIFNVMGLSPVVE